MITDTPISALQNIRIFPTDTFIPLEKGLTPSTWHHIRFCSIASDSKETAGNGMTILICFSVERRQSNRIYPADTLIPADTSDSLNMQPFLVLRNCARGSQKSAENSYMKKMTSGTLIWLSVAKFLGFSRRTHLFRRAKGLTSYACYHIRFYRIAPKV